MKLAISLLNFRPGAVGGAETCLRELIAHLPQTRGQDEIWLVMNRRVAATLTPPGDPGIRPLLLDIGDKPLVGLRCMEAFTPLHARRIERELEQLAPDATLFPQQSIFPRRCPGAVVLTVHDLQHLRLPENFGFFDRRFRAAIYPWSLDHAHRIIAISRFTAADLQERCGVPAGKITVVPNGFTPNTTASPPPPDLPASYLYYPAATLPHKNHAELLRTLAALMRQPGFEHHLVLTGQRTGHWKELRRLIRRLGMADRVHHLGFVTGAVVRSLYAHAAAVVFPSLFEGFGLPVIEAAMMGVRVIASRLPVYEELGLPAQWMIDFSDPAQLLAALSQPGPTVLAREPWTWKQATEATLNVLRDAARQRLP